MIEIGIKNVFPYFRRKKRIGEASFVLDFQMLADTVYSKQTF